MRVGDWFRCTALGRACLAGVSNYAVHCQRFFLCGFGCGNAVMLLIYCLSTSVCYYSEPKYGDILWL